MSKFPDTSMKKAASPTEPSIGDPSPLDKNWCINMAKPEDSSDFFAEIILKYQEELIRLSSKYDTLLTALRTIAGGSFHSASTLAIEGDWKGFVDKLQDIATTALNQVGEL